ncbi:conserved hypothetical protein [Trichinella spiralis]|uniref:hypothetical protein n=1 Tax=Trichinella spiralis TaxID=6334 RepID=UPI0001EFDA08|nr:conserved hypothetical protein [Trichinella spiralis]
MYFFILIISSVLVQDKKGCKGGVTTKLDVTAVIRRTPHGDDCPGSAEEPKTIPQFYDEEAAVASADPSTSGQFPLFKNVRSTMYKQRAKRCPDFPEIVRN